VALLLDVWVADKSVEPVARIRAYFEFLRDETVGPGSPGVACSANFSTEIVDHTEAIREAVQHGFAGWVELLGSFFDLTFRSLLAV
jgi:TetR/AcrR family transcriptional repressor of nem operon